MIVWSARRNSTSENWQLAERTYVQVAHCGGPVKTNSAERLAAILFAAHKLGLGKSLGTDCQLAAPLAAAPATATVDAATWFAGRLFAVPPLSRFELGGQELQQTAHRIVSVAAAQRKSRDPMNTLMAIQQLPELAAPAADTT